MTNVRQEKTNVTPRKTILNITFTALFASLIAGGAFIAIPVPFSPVPIVLQNLFIVLAGLVLGPALGSAAAALYLIAGALGLPVFAGATGGFAHFAGPTGGFLCGYFFAALAAGIIARRPNVKSKAPLLRIIIAAVFAFLVIYIPGVLWLERFVGSVPKALIAGFFPFLIGDAIKIAIAISVAGRLRRTVADQLNG
jgi:biotin transport system substrate-specific component